MKNAILYLSIFILLCGTATGAYITTIDPPSMVDSAVTSEHYVNYMVVGESSGTSASENYVSGVGAVSPTSGAYKVYLFCPSSSYVGSSLNCNLVIQNEGDLAIESISMVWVDNNNNGIPDSVEPQMSFSKMTQPNQNVTLPISLNVPSSNPAEMMPVRVTTQYVGSSHPNSTASVSVQFFSCPAGTTLCSDGTCKASCGGSSNTGGGSGSGWVGGGSVVVPDKSNETTVNSTSYLTVTYGNTACKVRLVRVMTSGKDRSVITNTLANRGEEECVLTGLRFVDVFPAGLDPGEAVFSLPYESINGSKVTFLFQSILPGESRTVQYSFSQNVPQSSLAGFNASELAITDKAGAYNNSTDGGFGVPIATDKGKITILDYPESVTLDANGTVTSQVIVKNTGNGTLYRTRLLISGLSLNLYATDPVAVDIKAGETRTFETTFTGNGPAQYPFKFIVSSRDDEAEALSNLLVVTPGEQPNENGWNIPALIQILSSVGVAVLVVFGVAILLALAGKTYQRIRTSKHARPSKMPLDRTLFRVRSALSRPAIRPNLYEGIIPFAKRFHSTGCPDAVMLSLYKKSASSPIASSVVPSSEDLVLLGKAGPSSKFLTGQFAPVGGAVEATDLVHADNRMDVYRNAVTRAALTKAGLRPSDYALSYCSSFLDRATKSNVHCFSGFLLSDPGKTIQEQHLAHANLQPASSEHDSLSWVPVRRVFSSQQVSKIAKRAVDITLLK